jgi:Ca2+-transporting ATPase
VEPLAEARRAEIAGAAAAMASSALRVLALAYRALEAADPGSAEQDLIFAGLAGMIDPPREEAREAVRVCRAAGIRPVMITGDHPSTALAIARELGIAGPGDFARSGSDLDETPDAGIAERVDRIAVYARVSAEHKLRVVRAWKARGEVVAMTGDGVNDAPAVKAADIGIAMGLGGTDVTREASAMVLLDDNFASIVSAVEEGRGIYDNIQKILQYLLSCNFGEILLMLGAALVGWPAPLIPVQILWVNLVTDGLPALALSMEKPEPGIMRGRPRVPGAAILSAGMAWQVVGQGILVGATALLAFGAVYTGEPESLARARTTAFCVLGCTQLLLAFAARSWQLVLWELGLFTNPYLFAAVAVSGLLQLSVVAMPFARPFFETATHLTWEWGLVAALTFLPVTLAEVLKLLRRLVSRRRAAGGEEIR